MAKILSEAAIPVWNIGQKDAIEPEGYDMKKKTPSVGEKAPDFQLSTSENKKFKLSSFLKSGRTVLLVFYRGHW